MRVKKSILQELIKNFGLKDIEKHLAYYFLTCQKLDYTKSPLLEDYFKDFEQNSNLYLSVSSLDITTLKKLEQHLELLISIEDRKLNGAFFTPEYIIQFIINQVSPTENDKCLDPSCGCGAFLIGLAEYYKNKFGISVKKVINKNIFGSDILKYNIERAKVILSIYALQNGEYLEDTDFNLYCQDSLRTQWEDKFDVIVGNPPYVKFQHLSDDNRKYLFQHWRTIENGTFNLYFAFFELGYKLLKDTGKLGYITPNNYFTSLAGEALRKYFSSTQCVYRIVDFSHKKVFDAQTYTAITFINKQENQAIYYDRINEGQNPETFLLNVNGSPNDIKQLNVKKWRLLKSNEQKNIQIIEHIGTPLKQLFDICVGIATLKDDVFFVDGANEETEYMIKTTENGTFKIEKSITKPVYKISDFKIQEEVNRNKRRIICPYNFKNGTVQPITEVEFGEKYPECYQYLLSEKETLLNRDKGKVKFEPFFAWGRTQGLTKKGKKILNPTFSQFPRFLIAEEEDAYFTNGYGIFFKEQESNELSLFHELQNPITKVENIDVVQKILNSIVMHYYVSKTSVAIEGGYPCYQKNFIEKFSIPHFSQEEINIVRSLGEKNEIDQFLIDKYQLNIPLPNLFS